MTRAEAIQALAEVFGDEIRYQNVMLSTLLIAAARNATTPEAADKVEEAVTVLLGGAWADKDTGEMVEP